MLLEKNEQKTIFHKMMRMKKAMEAHQKCNKWISCNKKYLNQIKVLAYYNNQLKLVGVLKKID